MLPVKIERISHQTELSPAGSVRKLVRVDFRVGDHGPFNLSFPEDGFNQGAAFQEIGKFADTITALVLKTETQPS